MLTLSLQSLVPLLALEFKFLVLALALKVQSLMLALKDKSLVLDNGLTPSLLVRIAVIIIMNIISIIVINYYIQLC